MRTILIASLICLLSCQPMKEKESPPRELVPNPEKFEHDHYDSAKICFQPDTSLNKISLLSAKNIESYLGPDATQGLGSSGSDIPYLIVNNINTEQTLILYFHPGSTKNNYSEFKVTSEIIEEMRYTRVIKDSAFSTESGIKLNMTLGNFLSIKGKPDTITKSDKNLFYHYRITKDSNKEFMSKYNMPLYKAYYKFNNGYLTEFRFGFEYP